MSFITKLVHGYDHEKILCSDVQGIIVGYFRELEQTEKRDRIIQAITYDMKVRYDVSEMYYATLPERFCIHKHIDWLCLCEDCGNYYVGDYAYIYDRNHKAISGGPSMMMCPQRTHLMSKKAVCVCGFTYNLTRGYNF